MSAGAGRIALRFAMLAMACPLAAFAAPPSCPEVTGSFTVNGDPAVVSDALRALGTGGGDAAGASLTLSGSPRATLRLSVMPARPDRFSRPTEWTLNNPADFRCEGGWLVLSRPVTASRRVRDGLFSGRSIVRLAPAAGGDLQIEVRFKGGETTRIYSYDSATIDLPLPWSRAAATDRLAWPEGLVAVFRPEPAPVAEPARVAEARRLLGSTGLRVGNIVADETAVRAKVSATPRDLVRLEDKLRAAGVAYEVPASPVQTASAYVVDLVLPQRPGATSQPSRQWVEQELTSWRHPSADVNKVDCRDGACIAQLGLRSGLSAEDAVQRVRSMSQAFSDVRVLPGTERALSPSLRVVDVQLRPR
ncbi:hypothetical protein [Pelomonas sp. Root1237]|uniref:hypothetical protein n=1 Tax=Pelomonas sp. Root1237 TaxID=1736434 RepID=UPI0006F97730|nr:hypothetical protein [Pelomonas sp. Root1237]